jgi:hypothetical protein
MVLIVEKNVVVMFEFVPVVELLLFAMLYLRMLMIVVDLVEIFGVECEVVLVDEFHVEDVLHEAKQHLCHSNSFS